MGVSHRSLGIPLKAALRILYPPQCLRCSCAVGQDGALCHVCWSQCEFIASSGCNQCGAMLPDGAGDGASLGPDLTCPDLICDDCLRVSRPWQKGRAAVVYSGVGRDLVLSLKHADRPDLAAPLGLWLARASADLASQDTVVVPVPIHPRRLLKRKYNQSALLAAQVARANRLRHLPGALRRTRATPSQDHRSIDERFDNQLGAFAVSTGHAADIAGRKVLLIDDVMASGATLTCATQALLAGGACSVNVAVLARAQKN